MDLLKSKKYTKIKEVFSDYNLDSKYIPKYNKIKGIEIRPDHKVDYLINMKDDECIKIICYEKNDSYNSSNYVATIVVEYFNSNEQLSNENIPSSIQKDNYIIETVQDFDGLIFEKSLEKSVEVLAYYKNNICWRKDNKPSIIKNVFNCHVSKKDANNGFNPNMDIEINETWEKEEDGYYYNYRHSIYNYTNEVGRRYKPDEYKLIKRKTLINGIKNT